MEDGGACIAIKHLGAAKDTQGIASLSKIHVHIYSYLFFYLRAKFTEQQGPH